MWTWPTRFLLWLHHCVRLVPPVSDETEKSPLTNSPLTALTAWSEGASSTDYTEIVTRPDAIHWNLNIVLTKLPSLFVFNAFMKDVFLQTGQDSQWHLFRWGLLCFLYNLGSMSAGTKATAIWHASWRHRTHTWMHHLPVPQCLDSECYIFLFCIVFFFCFFSTISVVSSEICARTQDSDSSSLSHQNPLPHMFSVCCKFSRSVTRC